MLELWRDEMYLGAIALWPDLTPQQFGDTARAWIACQQGSLTLQQIAAGIEQELRIRYGDPGPASPLEGGGRR